METRVLPTLHFFPNLPNAGTLLIPVNNTLLLIKSFFFKSSKIQVQLCLTREVGSHVAKQVQKQNSPSSCTSDEAEKLK